MQAESKVASRSAGRAAADQIKSTAFNGLLPGPVQGTPEDTGLAGLTLHVVYPAFVPSYSRPTELLHH